MEDNAYVHHANQKQSEGGMDYMDGDSKLLCRKI